MKGSLGEGGESTFTNALAEAAQTSGALVSLRCPAVGGAV